MATPPGKETIPDYHDVSACRSCKRLVNHLKQQKKAYPHYHNAPVAGFGESGARLMIVGLAPGLHGANASGIPFTGDSSGQTLFRQLENHGFAHQSADRGHTDLLNCRITNAVKCLPPKNLPSATEVKNCNPYLRQEIEMLPRSSIILALGVLAHKAVLQALDLKQVHLPFAHLAEYRLPDSRILLDSYHCSRYNMNTRRLSEAQFSAVFSRVQQLLT